MGSFRAIEKEALGARVTQFSSLPNTNELQLDTVYDRQIIARRRGAFVAARTTMPAGNTLTTGLSVCVRVIVCVCVCV